MSATKNDRMNITIDIIDPNSKRARILPPHIRKNKIAGHYGVIIGEDGNAYLYMPMTTHQIKRNVSMELIPNPNRNSTRTSYVILRLRKSKKGAFSAPMNWQLSRKDLAVIVKYAKSKIK